MKLSTLLAKVVLPSVLVLGIMAAVPGQVRADDTTDPPKVHEIKKMLKESPTGTLHVVGSVTIDNTSKDEVFNFISNPENDVLWYPGTLSSQLVSGDGSAGSVYQEVVFFFNQQIPVTVTILKDKPDHSFWFTSNGVFTNLTEYKVQNAPHDKVVFTLESTVEATNGVTQDFFEQYLTFTLQSLLNAMGKTGTVEIKK